MPCLIATPCSGSGKTLLSLCLASLARERGANLQPFKVGPDYLDPQLLTRVSGQSCRNLDTLLCGENWVQRCFKWHGSRADLVLVEGVMGLFDGRGPGSDGSSAAIAHLLGLPVVLVVEAMVEEIKLEHVDQQEVVILVVVEEVLVQLLMALNLNLYQVVHLMVDQELLKCKKLIKQVVYGI